MMCTIRFDLTSSFGKSNHVDFIFIVFVLLEVNWQKSTTESM